MNYLRIGVVVVLVLLGAYVALAPAVIYAPAPRVVLYLLMACLPAILFAVEATTRFKMQLPGFVATAGGAAAVVCLLLVLLTYLSKPDKQIAVFYVVDQTGQPIAGLDRVGALRVPTTDSGLSVTHFIDGNAIILIFPEQVPFVELYVKPVSNGPVYAGRVTYGGNRESRLVLGSDLRSPAADQS